MGRIKVRMIGVWLLRLYRVVVPVLFGRLRPVPGPYRFSESGISAFASACEGSIWFHAASAGELESLVPLVERAILERHSIVLTSFSPSSFGRLEKLVKDWGQRFPQGRFLVGASPAEGDWKRWLLELKVRRFVTVKYEAWPDLWASLVELGIPMVLIGAQGRPSLRRMARAFRILGFETPRMVAVLADPADEDSLRQSLPQVPFVFGGDPRWDRVQARLVCGNDRVKSLLTSTRDSRQGRREGVLGSVWDADLALILKTFESRLDHFLWVVPHDVESESVEKVIRRVTDSLPGESVQRSSRLRDASCSLPSNTRIVVVDEIGFLAELYHGAMWAYVGGGFGAGVHSTLEPAVSSLPVASGPSRVEVFSETRMLRRIGQLTVVRDQAEFASWLDRVDHLKLNRTEEWKSESQRQLGATERIWRVVSDFVEDP